MAVGMELPFSGLKMSDQLRKNHNECIRKDWTTQNVGKAEQTDKSPNGRPNALYQFNLFNCFYHSTPLSLAMSHLKQAGSPFRQLTSLFEFIFINYLLISLFIVSRCYCQHPYFLPSHYDFRMCSNGFRISIYSVKSFNSSSGEDP